MPLEASQELWALLTVLKAVRTASRKAKAMAPLLNKAMANPLNLTDNLANTWHTLGNSSRVILGKRRRAIRDSSRRVILDRRLRGTPDSNREVIPDNSREVIQGKRLRVIRDRDIPRQARRPMYDTLFKSCLRRSRT